MNPFVIDARRPGGAASAHREPSAAYRGDGGRAPERRAQGVARPLAGDVLLPAPASRTGFRDFYAFLAGEDDGDRELAMLLRPFATGSLRHLLSDGGDDLLGKEALVTVFDLRLLEPELRPAAAMVCTETVWAAAARDPRPRLLVVDEVWSIMQHPEGAAFLVSMAKRAPKAPAGPSVHNPGRPGPAQRGHLARDHRPLRAGAAPERGVQAASPAGRGGHREGVRGL